MLNLDKPAGLTSAAAVGRVRRSSGEKRVGHGGTLDPSATGVLPIFFGRATVLAEYLSAQGKEYAAHVVLGAASSTDDAEGEISAVPVPPGVDAPTVSAALSSFVGEVDQAPPAYSAVKIGGERSYRLARRGDEPQPAARRVRLDAATLTGLSVDGDGSLVAAIKIECGPGFYVRSLARDLGASLGTRGHLRSLRRTRVGPLQASESIELEAAEALGADLAPQLQPAALAASALIEVLVLPSDEGRLAHGMEVAAPVVGDGPAFARAEDGRLLAIGDLAAGRFHPRRLVELA
ncbi:MAG: tRNA pseudouridine(55) synthase TruB [Candidatus Dormibacteria bacterium]